MQDVKSEIRADGRPVAEIEAAAADAAAATHAPGGTEAAVARSARIAWFATEGAETRRDRPAPRVSLPAPLDVRATRGRGRGNSFRTGNGDLE